MRDRDAWSTRELKMGNVIQSERTALEGEDFGWMVGRAVAEVTFHEPSSWWFDFTDGGFCKTDGGTWRLLNRTSMIACSIDHGHQFGLPEPLDSLKSAQAALQGSRIVAVRVRQAAPDLEISFDSGHMLEFLTLSAGYECWQTRDPSGRCVVVNGNRDASTWHE